MIHSSSFKRDDPKKSGALIGKRASLIMNFREKQHMFKSGLVKQSQFKRAQFKDEESDVQEAESNSSNNNSDKAGKKAQPEYMFPELTISS